MPWTTETLLKAVAEHAPAECVTIERMAELSGMTWEQVSDAAPRLARHGFLKRTRKGCYTLTDAGHSAIADGARLRSGPKGAHTGQRRCDHGLRQRAWNALRMGRKVTLDDILMLAVEGDERDAYANIRKYVKALKRAGYVAVMGQREAPLGRCTLGCQRMVLLPERDTGPLAPVWRQSRNTVYDPNTDTEVALEAA